MITEIACDCQLGFSFGYGFNQGKQNKTKKAATIFFATDALFMDPQKRNSFSSLWVQLLCWWARGQLAEAGRERERERSVEQEDSRDKVAGNRRKQLLIDFGLSFGIWQISCLSCRCCRWRCRKDRWKRSTSCVHVAALSTQPPPLPSPPLATPRPQACPNSVRFDKCVSTVDWSCQTGKQPKSGGSEKEKKSSEWSRELSSSRKNRNKCRGKWGGRQGGRYRNKATNLGFNK